MAKQRIKQPKVKPDRSTLIADAKAAYQHLVRVRDSLNQYEEDELYDLSYSDMHGLYHAMKTKSAEKFIEGWVANLIGGRKIKNTIIPKEYQDNDNGDIWAGDELVIGKNNIELKSIFQQGGSIGGGQFRFYENVPWYMMFRACDENHYEIFLLRKEQLISEMIYRTQTYGYVLMSSSQGSGVIKALSESQRIDRLYKNLTGEYQDKLGWDFNARTEPEYYTRFKNLYQIAAEDVMQKVNAA